jgi:hypothetical protein
MEGQDKDGVFTFTNIKDAHRLAEKIGSINAKVRSRYRCRINRYKRNRSAGEAGFKGYSG